MAKMMKRMGKMTGGNPAALAQMLGGGGGAPDADGNMTPPQGMPGMGGGMGGGLGGGLPGLGGLGGRGGMPQGLPGLGMPRGGKKKKR